MPRNSSFFRCILTGFSSGWTFAASVVVSSDAKPLGTLQAELAAFAYYSYLQPHDGGSWSRHYLPPPSQGDIDTLLYFILIFNDYYYMYYLDFTYSFPINHVFRTKTSAELQNYDVIFRGHATNVTVALWGQALTFLITMLMRSSAVRIGSDDFGLQAKAFETFLPDMSYKTGSPMQILVAKFSGRHIQHSLSKYTSRISTQRLLPSPLSSNLYHLVNHRLFDTFAQLSTNKAN